MWLRQSRTPARAVLALSAHGIKSLQACTFQHPDEWSRDSAHAGDTKFGPWSVSMAQAKCLGGCGHHSLYVQVETWFFELLDIRGDTLFS